MFDIGFWEILLIGVVALLVVGPERLPALATLAGQWIGRLKRFANHMRNEIQQELETEHLKSLVDEQNRELQSLRREVEGVRDDAEKVMRDTRDSVQEAERAVTAEPRGRTGADAESAAVDDAAATPDEADAGHERDTQSNGTTGQ